jgi:predicted RNA-binding protein with EMAP domain
MIAHEITKTPRLMEVKQEINQIVDALPKEVLDELLQYLRQVEKASQEKIRLSLNLKTILTQDKDLLERLAK